MRVLEHHEYTKVGGAGMDTYNIYTPVGATITTHLEVNNSTTITFDYGPLSLTWNSGTYMACALIGGGVGIAVTSYTGNPKLGSLAAMATSAGCTFGVNSMDEDGDEYGG